jgi:Ca2+-binding EF-hand superfamily protein
MLILSFEKKEYIDGCHASGNKASDEALTKAFQLFDVNNDKFMDKKEFYCAMNFLAATV